MLLKRLFRFLLVIINAWLPLNNAYAQELNTPKLIVPFGNTGRVDVIGFDADSEYLAASSGADQIVVWEVLSGKIINHFYTGSRVTQAHFSGDELWISNTLGELKSWSLKGKSKSFTFPVHKKAINDFEVWNDKLITVSEEGRLAVFDMASRSTDFYIDEIETSFSSVTVCKANSLLVAGDRSGNVLIYNLLTKEKEFYGQVLKKGINDLEFSANGDRLFAAESGGFVYELSLNPVQIISQKKLLEFQVNAIEWSGKYILASGRGKSANFKIVDWADSTQIITLPFDDQVNQPEFVYGINEIKISDSGLLAVPDYNGTIRVFDLKKRVGVSRLRGYASPVSFVHVDFNKNLTLVKGSEILNMDLDGRFTPRYIDLASKIVKADLQTNRVAILTADTLLRVLENEKQIFSKKLNAQAFVAPVKLSLDGTKVVYRNSREGLSIVELNSGKEKRIRVADCYSFSLSYNGIAAHSQKASLTFFDWKKLKKEWKLEMPELRFFDTDEEGRFYAGVFSVNNTLEIRTWEADDSKFIYTIQLPDTMMVDAGKLSDDLKYFYSWSRSVGSNNGKADYSIVKWSLEENNKPLVFNHHNHYVSSVFEGFDEVLFSASSDGTVFLSNKNNTKTILHFIPLMKDNWAVMDSYGRFDASRVAMRKLNFSLDNQLIELDQIKQSFYEPKLIQKALGLTDESYYTESVTKTFTLHPEIHIKEPENGVLHFKLEDQGGGIGKVSVHINNKEMTSDVRGLSIYDTVTASVDFPIVPAYVRPEELNRLSIEAFNEKGVPISKRKKVYYLPGSSTVEREIKREIYVLAIGISDYMGTAIDLNFAAKDATDFTNVIENAAKNQFGENNVHIYSLTTESDKSRWPLKNNILSTLEEISQKAGPEDVLVVYYAGHGLDVEEDDDFYFLTAEAHSPFVNSAREAKSVSISGTELAGVLNSVAAIDQLLIVDACHSGNLTGGVLESDGQFKTEGIRALNTVKDRTGTYILASSEGDEVSFESGHLEQGLLTYSLLFGFKGEALLKGEMLDVVSIMQYVRNKVPELAGDIGKTQVPVLQIPHSAESFSIGTLSLNERNDIPLNSAKPIVVSSNFQEMNSFIDERHFGLMLDEKLKKMRQSEGNNYLFIEEGRVFNNAFSVYGRYSEAEGMMNIKYSVFKNRTMLFTDNIEVRTMEDGVQEISEKLFSIIRNSND